MGGNKTRKGDRVGASPYELKVFHRGTELKQKSKR